MNRHTFGDAASGRKKSVDIELAMNSRFDDDDDDDDDNGEAGGMAVRTARGFEDVEEECQDPKERFNDAGEVLDPFNLDNEREGGTFDEEGNYRFAKETGPKVMQFKHLPTHYTTKHISPAGYDRAAEAHARGTCT